MAGTARLLRRGAVLLALLVGAPLSAAQDKPQAAGPFDLRSFTCPLGGAKFNQDVGYSAYPLLTLPDGSWIGDFQIGTQVPVCPGNGLVLIPDFDLYETQAYGGGKIALTAYSPAELARLPALIADPEYRALKADGPYAQAWWLASKLDRSAYGRFHLLQRSTWPTRDPLVRRRLVERFAAEAPALIEAAKVPEAHRFELYGFVINALRELGQFDQARDLLRRVNMRAAALPAGPDQAVPDPLQTPIGRAIAQRDDGWFAAETMPAKLFGGLCRGELSTLYGPVRPATKAACKLREDRETRAERDEQMTFDESSRLKRDPAALSAACAKTAQPQRGVGLAQACDELQFAQDRLAADRLAQDGPALAAACAATPVGQRSGALYQACSSFDIASTSALETVLLDDPEAFAVLCPKTEIEQLADAMQWAALACGGSARGLLERAQDKLLLDLPVLDARCATLAADDYREPALNAACFKRKLERDSALANRLASDPAAFAALCGKLDLKAEVDFEAEQSATVLSCLEGERVRELRAAEAREQARGLECSGDPEERICSDKAAVAAARAARDPNAASNPFDRASRDQSYFSEGSSLSQAARTRAAAVIAEAKRTRTYPKRQPGDEP